MNLWELSLELDGYNKLDQEEYEELDDEDVERHNALIKLNEDLGKLLEDTTSSRFSYGFCEQDIELFARDTFEGALSSIISDRSEYDEVLDMLKDSIYWRIDWKSYARELATDFTEVEWQGETYYVQYP